MTSDTSGSLRLFRAFGIDVFIHWTWWALLAVVLFLNVLGDPVLTVAIFLALFAIVTLHEFGHALACRSVGGQANRIVLWPLGGIAFVRPPERPDAMLWTIVAGPLVNVALVPVTLVLFGTFVGNPLEFPWFDAAATQQLLREFTIFERFVAIVTWMNFLLLVFNMLPIYPLDGGQTLQAILWFGLGRARSLHIAASIGFVLAIVGGSYAFFIRESIWLTILAVFIGMEALNGIRMAKTLAAQDAMRM
ncbi:site-2 protease family protein [Phycisphaerales bacterium AB-hyl4]|uniref:Site-2 protease family protein n=1 Tax=Natronomicrosphaera hydrolytica TaxID=3242702 RepID=A0ABV4U2N8_9BACT